MKLCYVREGVLYFTKKDLEKQWGDDWNDKPYEHNAGEPYYDAPEDIAVYRLEMDESRVIIEEPCSNVDNSIYSVEDINNRLVPWLKITVLSGENMHLYSVFAGAFLDEVNRIVGKHGGTLIPLKIEEVA